MSETIENGNTKPRIRIVADGIQASYYFSFPIFSVQDVMVYLDNILQTSGYTIERISGVNGGTVIFAEPPAKDTVITFIRSLELKRTTNFKEVGPFMSSKVNYEFDYQLACMEQLEELIGRTVTFPPYAPSRLNVSLPMPEAGKAIVWSNGEDSLQNSSFRLQDLEQSIADTLNAEETVLGYREECQNIYNNSLAINEKIQSSIYGNQLTLHSIIAKSTPEILSGTLPLFTPGGELITACDKIYPDFWNDITRFKALAIAGDENYAAYNKTQEEYDAEITAKNFCGYFVIDETAKTVRLPYIGNAVLHGQSEGEEINQLDQIQGHQHNIWPGIGGMSIGGGNISKACPGSDGIFNTNGMVSDSQYGDVRMGSYTRPRQIGIYYFIVAGTLIQKNSAVNEAALVAQLIHKSNCDLGNISEVGIRKIINTNLPDYTKCIELPQTLHLVQMAPEDGYLYGREPGTEDIVIELCDADGTVTFPYWLCIYAYASSRGNQLRPISKGQHFKLTVRTGMERFCFIPCKGVSLNV